MRIVAKQRICSNVTVDGLGFGMDSKAGLGTRTKNSNGIGTVMAVLRSGEAPLVAFFSS